MSFLTVRLDEIDFLKLNEIKMKKIIMALLLAVAFFGQESIAQNVANPPTGKVLSAYLSIKNALVANDAKAATAAAKTLLDEIGKVEMGKMTAEQHDAWMKYTKKLSFDATHISETGDIDHQREHFTSLSKNMYAVIKAFPTSTPVYYQFCPMANEGKGAYWLSEQEKISNPYYGGKMNSCPSTKEVIQVK